MHGCVATAQLQGAGLQNKIRQKLDTILRPERRVEDDVTVLHDVEQ